MAYTNARTILILFLWMKLGFLSAHAQGQSPKICPDEPIVTAQTPCPPVCNGGCETDVTCPDTMPCRINCNGRDSLSSCNKVVATCSKMASCDALISLLGAVEFAFDCNETPHSCAIYTSDDATIWAADCDPSKSCNCDINIGRQWARTNCTRGLDCITDRCFSFRNLSNPCLRSLLDGTMEIVLENDQCSCQCKDQSLTRFVLDYFGLPPFYYCKDPETVCNTDADCNPPFGSCSANWKFQCQCYNPYGGPRCQQHMCPHCQNSALCGSSFPGECVCTGAWGGPNCTEPLMFNASDPISARCASLRPTGPPAGAIAAGPVADIPCPAPCTNCTSDTDGTWVCLILGVPTYFNFTCPSTHRCVVVCREAEACMGSLYCNGDLPCDLASLSTYPSINFNCGSSSVCRTSFSNLKYSQPLNSHPNSEQKQMGCTYPGGACVCEDKNHFFAPCVPGSSCNGDPCAGYTCRSSQIALYNQSSGECFCRCVTVLHETSTGQCVPLDTVNDCAPSCLNGGVCKQGKCWCAPGFSGVDCSRVDACVPRNTTGGECPAACSWCDSGVCFQDLPIAGLDPAVAVCPIGWPCVFICRGSHCNAKDDILFCPLGSGPCDVWCWDSLTYATAANSIELIENRPITHCSRLTLKCEDGNQRCRARCTSIPDVSIYRQARTIRAITCGNSHVASTSPSPLGVCSNECGSDSCYIAETDPCYFNYTTMPIKADFAFFCPRDNLNKWLVPYPNNVTNTCACDCEPGLQLINGSCVASGCDPTCKNGGICTSSENPSSFLCRCFFGWTGKDCTSRCFFPINANVTACYNGLYQISGALNVNVTKLDLYKDVQDLVVLVVDGSVTTSGNSTLSIALSGTSALVSGSNAGIQVSNNLTLSGGSTLETSISVRNGVPVTAVLNVTGTVILLSGSQIKLFTNATEIEELLKTSPASQLKVDLVNFGSTIGDADLLVDLGTTPSNGQCSRVRATMQPNSNNGPGSLSVVFSLDDSLCASPLLPSPSSVSVVAVGVGVTLAVVAIGAIIAAVAVPSIRAKVFPFLQRGSRESGSAARGLDDAIDDPNATEMNAGPKAKWSAAQKPQL